jgi:hypothetical protein
VIGGMDGGWITVIVLVLVLGLTVVVEVGAVDDGVVSVTVAGGTAVVVAPVVTVDVDTDVETEVLVELSGLSTPQARRWSDDVSSMLAL